MNASDFHCVSWTVLLAIAPGIPVAAQEAVREPSDWLWNDPREVTIPGVTHHTLESQSMKRTVGFNVYLPRPYHDDPDRRFPVVYFLHGAGGTETSDAGLARLVDEEIQAGRIEPCIYVFPNGGKRSGYRDWQSGNVLSETLIMKELIPHVDREFRTIADRRQRGICGFSMGGGGALRLALKYPQHFCAAASLAAAIDDGAEGHAGENVFTYLQQNSEKIRSSLKLWMVVGDQDFLFSRHAPFVSELDQRDVSHSYRVLQGEGHNLGRYTEFSGVDMIRFLAAEIDSRPSGTAKEVRVWPADRPPPDARSLPVPEGIQHYRVHEALHGDSDDFGWLLGAAIVQHQGKLYASWGNSHRHENSADAHMRGRMSTDGGRTWSPPFAIAPAVSGEGRHAHGSFLSAGGRLYAFVSYHHGQGHQQLKTRLFLLDEKNESWTLVKDLIPGFYPMDQPQQLADGSWIMGGFDGDMRGAVAISDGDDILAPWRVRTIGDVPRGFETSIWVDGMEVTAFIRQSKKSEKGVVYLAAVVSGDGGESWDLGYQVEVPKSGLPSTDAKVYAGRLSSGQRYLIFNTPVDGDFTNRNALCMAVTACGESTFSNVFAIRTFGETAPRTQGQYKNHGWQYPYAHEHDGHLYVVYARAKEDCELSVIPVNSLEPTGVP